MERRNRILYTLYKFIELGKQSNNFRTIQQAKEAEEIISNILENVSVEINNNNWKSDEYDKTRWQIAEQIIKLNTLLEKRMTRK